MYENYNLSALKRADGDTVKAREILNVGYWKYYYELEIYNKFVEWKNEKNKTA